MESQSNSGLLGTKGQEWDAELITVRSRRSTSRGKKSFQWQREHQQRLKSETGGLSEGIWSK